MVWHLQWALWKAEQAFVMSYKPLNEKTHNLQLQSAANTSNRWAVFSESGGERSEAAAHIGPLKIYCQSAICCILLKTDKTFFSPPFIKKGQNTTGWVWEVIQDIILSEIRPWEWSVVQWLLYFPELKQPRLTSAAVRGGGKGLSTKRDNEETVCKKKMIDGKMMIR